MHGRLFDEISISVFLFNQVVHKDGAERSQTAVLKLDVQDSCGMVVYRAQGWFSPSDWSWSVSRLTCYRHRSLVKVITRETGCGPLVLVCCVSVPPRVRIERARCCCMAVNWQSAPTFCCSLLPRCCLLQKRGESVYVGVFFQSPRAFTLTKPLLWAPTAHRVTFLPARRRILGILRMQMQHSLLFYVLRSHRAVDPIFVGLCV